MSHMNRRSVARWGGKEMRVVEGKEKCASAPKVIQHTAWLSPLAVARGDHHIQDSDVCKSSAAHEKKQKEKTMESKRTRKKMRENVYVTDNATWHPGLRVPPRG